MTTLVMSLIRMSALLIVTLATMPLLRNRSAALRAWIIATGLAGAAVVPLVQLVAPAWGTPLPDPGMISAGDSSLRLLLFAWGTGALLHLLVLFAGLFRLMSMAAAADPIRDGQCADRALEIGAEYRVHAPVLLLEADRATLPVTWGHWQPRILLPPSARQWSDDRVRIVLRHEMAHVRRRDWLLQVFASIVRSVYWFHPLVWLACRQWRLETERACDDVVLASGVTGAEYASQLLDLARGYIGARQLTPVSALIGPSTLERRVRSMLSTSTDRSPLRRWRQVVIATAMLMVTIAAAGYGAVDNIVATAAPLPPKRLTLLLDGRIMDLSKEWPTYPDPRAGLVRGPGLARALRNP